MVRTEKQRRFIVEYLVDFNGTQAAIRAGYSEASAGQAAFENLRNQDILDAVEEKIQEKLDVAELSVEWVLRQWKQIAEANPADIIWLDVECCRHCYGAGHQYQWTEFEYRLRLDQARAHVCNSKCSPPCVHTIPPINAGGFGFDPSRSPVAACPVCLGRGNERVRIAATRKLTGGARRLYAGIKQTQHGIEVKFRDQDSALQNIAKYFGMLIDKRELSGPNGGNIPLSHYDARDLTDDQLAQFIKENS